jgi:hypothetical protein
MPLGRGVVQGEGQPIADREPRDAQAQQDQPDGLGLVAEGIEEVVVGPIAVGDTGGAEPTGNGAASLGQEDADDESRHPPGVAAVHRRGELLDPEGQEPGQHDVIHPSRPPG